MPQTTLAIAGTGNAATMHALAIDEIDSATVVGAASRTESTGREFADDHGCEWFADVSEMLERTGADVLSVTTPSGAHLGPTRTAAAHGVDVLCEKPLEVTTQRIDEMARIAQEAGIRLGGVFQQRFNPVVRTVRDAIEAGRFGDLSIANAYVPWWRDDEYYQGSWKGTRDLDGGGALMNQSIHGVDAIQWLAGAAADELPEDSNPVAEVFAYTDTIAHDPSDVEVEDTAVVNLRYRSGALGQILASTSAYPGSLKRLQVSGHDGTATIREDELETWEFRDDRPDDDAVRDRFTTTESGGGAGDPMAIDVSNHRRNIEAFLEARAADEPCMVDATEARKAVEIIEAVYESAERNEPVDL